MKRHMGSIAARNVIGKGSDSECIGLSSVTVMITRPIASEPIKSKSTKSTNRKRKSNTKRKNRKNRK